MYYHRHIQVAGGRYLPETKAYRNRVFSDGGTVVNMDHIDNAFRTLIENGMYNSDTIVLAGANYGVKKNGIGEVEKLYDLSVNQNDFIQSTASKRPLWSISTGLAKITYDGVDDLLENISVSWNYYNVSASNVPWTTVSSIKRISGGNDWSLVTYDDGGNANVGLFRVVGDTDLLEIRITDDFGATVARGSASTLNTTDKYISTLTNVPPEFYINGSLDNAPTSLGNQTRTGIDRAVMGGQPQLGLYSNFDQYHIFNRRGAINSTQRSAIESHMNDIVSAY